MARYTVSIWNTELVEAVSAREAVAIISKEFADGFISARDFEYDDVEIELPKDYRESNWETWCAYLIVKSIREQGL